MKRSFVVPVLVGGVAATALAMVGPSYADSDGRVTLCHKSGVSYSALEVSVHAKSGHLGHGDVYPVPAAGCASLNVVAPTPVPTVTPAPSVTPVPSVSPSPGFTPPVSPFVAVRPDSPRGIPAWVQQYGRGEFDKCVTGWNPSWAKWPNNGVGGFVCTRSVPALGN